MWDSADICGNYFQSDNSLEDKESLPNTPTNLEESLYHKNASDPFYTTVTSCFAPQPLREEHDQQSQDSGYDTNFNLGSNEEFLSVLNEDSLLDTSAANIDDDFLESFTEFELIEENNENQMPASLQKLISAPINLNNKKQSPTAKEYVVRVKPLLRRALSMQNNSNVTPTKARSCLFRGDRCFKRPEPPTGTPDEIPSSKKLKTIETREDDLITDERMRVVPVLRRNLSVTEESIKYAVHKSVVEPELIGDYSKSCSLPLIEGRHQDLKTISSETLVQLLKGEFLPNVASFKVVDCRYPYEFEGGHIKGAVNIYTKDQCSALLEEHSLTKPSENGANILVFHCEFSSERGPNLCRYLRKLDRQMNENSYPMLHYPEIYILEGGYKKFFERFSIFCIPVAYKEMLHPGHENELKYFRQKSRTWNSDNKPRSSSRQNLKRL